MHAEDIGDWRYRDHNYSQDDGFTILMLWAELLAEEADLARYLCQAAPFTMVLLFSMSKAIEDDPPKTEWRASTAVVQVYRGLSWPISSIIIQCQPTWISLLQSLRNGLTA